jgi:hypothetical protein
MAPGLVSQQALVVEQLGYYRAWAPDYDDVYLGKLAAIEAPSG